MILHNETMPFEPDIPSSAELNPFLKWAGGKRWLVPELRPIWQRHREKRLVEPFCGGLSVALALQPNDALLNDLNEHAVNLFIQIKRGFKVKMRMMNDKNQYYAARDQFNRLVRIGKSDTAKAAELFYYLNRTCYNGLCRFNRSGEFNVPFGKYSTINYVRDFQAYASIFSCFTFSSIDFEALELRKDDFVYADPPYDVDFTQYSKEGFNWDDQIRLAQWLANHRGPVVLSNQATSRIVCLYRDLGFTLKKLRGPRRISCTGIRNSAPEVLATRNL